MTDKIVLELNITEFVDHGKISAKSPGKPDGAFTVNAANLTKEGRSAFLQIKGDFLNYLNDVLDEKLYRATLHTAVADKNYIAWMSFELSSEVSFSSTICYSPMADSDRETINKKYKAVYVKVTEKDIAPLLALKNPKKEEEPVVEKPKPKKKYTKEQIEEAAKEIMKDAV